MHAAGTDHGYLISWSRNNVSLHRVEYMPEFMQAAAHVLKYVFEAFIFVDHLPNIPHDMSSLPADVRPAWDRLPPLLENVMASVEPITLSRGAPCS